MDFFIDYQNDALKFVQKKIPWNKIHGSQLGNLPLHFPEILMYEKYNIITTSTTTNVLLPNYTISKQIITSSGKQILRETTPAAFYKYIKISTIEDIQKFINEYGTMEAGESIDAFKKDLWKFKFIYNMIEAMADPNLMKKSLKVHLLCDHVRNHVKEKLTFNPYLSNPFYKVNNHEFDPNKYINDKRLILYFDNVCLLAFDAKNFNEQNALFSGLQFYLQLLKDEAKDIKIDIEFSKMLTSNNDILPFKTTLVCTCVNLKTAFILYLIALTSSDNVKKCALCNGLFGIEKTDVNRPGKQKYCPACSPQYSYKNRQRQAKLDIKNGLSIEEASKKHGVSIERIQNILNGSNI